MRKLRKGIIAFGLSLAVAITAFPMNATTAYAADNYSEFARLATDYEVLGDATGSYIASTKDNGIAISKSGNGLLKATAMDPSYRTVDELITYYPPTRNQEPYGTCWAFSTVSLAEFDMVTKGYADMNVYFSPLHLAYYTYHFGLDKFAGNVGDSNSFVPSPGNSYLDDGGNQFQAMRMLAGWMGVASEAAYPYGIAGSTIYSPLNPAGAYNSTVATMLNAQILNIKEQPFAVKQAIIEHGAVGVSYYADLSYYSSAMYNGQTVSTYYYAGGEVANHAVAAVGWDDNFPRSAFISDPGRNGAWLIRNSWTTTTGNSLDSYFWISYADAGLSEDSYAEDFVPAGTYQNLYQYDGGFLAAPGIFENEAGYVVASANKVANIFSAKAGSPYGEQLEAVMLSFTEYADVQYTIKVYKNLKNKKNPSSGTCVATKTGYTTYPGIYTVQLDYPIEIDNGEQYSIVVTQNKGAYDLEFDYDMTITYGMGYVSNVTPSGNSYMYYDNEWLNTSDIARLGVGDFSIKAITNNSTTAHATSIKSVENTDKGVTVKWKKMAGAASYTLQRSTNKSNWVNVKTVSGTSYTDKSVKNKNGKKYYYRVVLNSNGVEKASASVKIMRFTKVQKVTAKNTAKGAITVKYKKNSKTKGYQIQVSKKKNFKSGTKTVKVSGKSRTSKLIKGLKKGKTYYVRVRCYKGDTYGPWSKIVKVKINR